jgi:hypothetical protein
MRSEEGVEWRKGDASDTIDKARDTPIQPHPSPKGEIIPSLG